MPPPPPEPPPTQQTDKAELAPTAVTTLQQTPSVCDTEVSEENDTGWDIDSELQYYSDNSEECENTWSSQIKSKVKTIVNNLFIAAKNPILRPDPICNLPQNEMCFEPHDLCESINDGYNNLTNMHGINTEIFALRGYDMETKELIKETKPWTNEWYGYTTDEICFLNTEPRVYSTETLCAQAMSKLSTMLDESTPDYDYSVVFQNDIDKERSSIEDETDINNIINAITHSPTTKTTLTKPEFKQLCTEGKMENIVMTISEDDPQMMDGGANRSVTDKKERLRRYRRLKHRIPVSGVAAGGPACYIEGYGYIDIETKEGNTFETIVYYCPNCRSTILSPNAIVAESKGQFTGWIQCSHMDLKKGHIEFFNRRYKRASATIPTTSNNRLWYIEQPKTSMMKKAGSRTEMYYEDRYTKAYINSMSIGA